MQAFLTLEDVLAIENRCSKTSKGPWKAWIEGRDHWGGDTFIRTGEDPDSVHASIELSGATDADHDFIAHAREDVPRLIADLRAPTSPPSNDALSADQLLEIETRCSKATGGPWRSFIEGRDHTSGSSFIQTSDPDIEASGMTDADQDFVAHARQDIPALIAEIRRLRQAE